MEILEEYAVILKQRLRFATRHCLQLVTSRLLPHVMSAGAGFALLVYLIDRREHRNKALVPPQE